MRVLNPETRVGLFTLTALAFLAFGVFWLNGGRLLDRGYPAEILFERVNGLLPGAPVKLAGVDIGRVQKVYFTPEQKVVVRVWLKPGVVIYEDSRAVITTAGVIGDNYLEIFPGKSRKVLAKGKRLLGDSPTSTEDFYRTAYEVLSALKSVGLSLQKLANDPEVADSIRNSLRRIEAVAANLQDFSAELNGIPIASIAEKIDGTLERIEQLASTAEPGLNHIVAQISQASDQLTAVLYKASRFLDDINDNGETGAKVRQILSLTVKTLSELESFSAALAQEKEHIGPLLADAEATAQSITAAADSIRRTFDNLSAGGSSVNLGDTLKKAGEMVDSAHNFILALQQMKNRVGFSGAENDWGLDYRLDAGLGGKSSVIFDWQAVGEDDRLSLQYGYSPTDNLRARLGYFNGDLGGGLDWRPAPNWTFSLDIWSPHRLNSDLWLTYYINSHWCFGLGAYDLNGDLSYGWQLGYWF